MRALGHGGQQRRADVAGDLHHLVRGQSGRRSRPGGQHDLDQRLQQAGAGKDAGRLVGGTRQGGRGDLVLALRQSQEGDPGLGPATKPAGASVRRFGIGERSPESMELGRLVHRLAEGFIGLGQSLARLPRLGGGALPCAVELTQLGAVEEAQPAEVHQLWLGLAPGIEGRGPLLRPAHIEDLVARRDDRAVGDAHDHRRDLACGRVDHHLVHQPDAAIDLAQRDQ